jgi:hypothetical protein
MYFMEIKESGSILNPKMLDPDPDQDEMNADQQP